MRWRTSVDAGPYSPAMLYGFAGNVPRPSVLLMAWFSVYDPVSETFLFAREFTFTINWRWLYSPDDSMRKTRTNRSNRINTAARNSRIVGSWQRCVDVP